MKSVRKKLTTLTGKVAAKRSTPRRKARKTGVSMTIRLDGATVALICTRGDVTITFKDEIFGTVIGAKMTPAMADALSAAIQFAADAS